MFERCLYCCTPILSLLLLLTIAPAQAQEGFGNAILVSGGEVLVGESDNLYRSGAVHIFSKRDGEWVQHAELTAPEATMNDHFGGSLAMDGQRLLVGSTGGDEAQGAAYVFEKDGTNWTYQATLSPPGMEFDEHFGKAVGLNGDAAFVGAPAADSSKGAVFVFERGMDGSWKQATRLTGSIASQDAAFGSAIASLAGQVFVGTPGLNEKTGGVFVFEADEEGTWQETNLLKGNVADEGDHYGASLDVAGDLLAVGVPRFSNRVGGSIVYRRNEESGNWRSSALLLPFAVASPPMFGMSVAIDEREVWVGAPFGNGFEGSAYRFTHENGSEFEQTAPLTVPELQRGDLFGYTLALEGDVGAISIREDDYGAGAVAVFERGEDGTWAQATLLRSTSVSGLEPITGGMVDCTDGSADMFSCDMVDLLSFLPIRSLGGGRGVRLNDIWGWTDPVDGREYALVGRMDGTAFVDVTDPYNPIFLGDLPKPEGTQGSVWRDIKVYDDHAFIVADNAGEHGIQVFDLTQLRDADGSMPTTFEVVARYSGIHSAHNIVINTDTGFAYTVGNSGGGETCGGGLHIVDVRNPLQPTFAGCYAAEGTGRAQTGYTHDAQCVIYDGPDTEHSGRELCFSSNETALNIADVTDKENPTNLATVEYPNVSYTHQGWISDDHRHFYVNDELDELNNSVGETRTLIWDITDIDDPQLAAEYMWGNKASDHNLYIDGNLMYQSNYVNGLRIHDISDPENPREVGYFDTMPVRNDEAGFAGSWSNYPYFESGTIVVSSIGEGLFVLKKKEELGL